MVNLIDTSVWVALYIDDDSQHDKAVELFKNIEGSFLLPYCVVEEVVSVVTYRHSLQQANTFLEFILKSRNIEHIEGDVFGEAVFFLSHSHKISFTDSALLMLAKKKGAKLITFDTQLARLAKL